jgi:hypothetical protein
MKKDKKQLIRISEELYESFYLLFKKGESLLMFKVPLLRSKNYH